MSYDLPSDRSNRACRIDWSVSNLQHRLLARALYSKYHEYLRIGQIRLRDLGLGPCDAHQ
jgi:hypothetical protein